MSLTIIKADRRAREKPCIRCGYSLRKVTDSPRCPECGLAVWLSLNNNDTLDNSNPEWLRRSALACWLLAAACFVACAASLSQAKYNFDTMRYLQQRNLLLRQFKNDGSGMQPYYVFLRTTPRPTPNLPLLRAARLVALGAFAATFAGLFLLTTREGRYPDKLVTYRLFARVLCAAAVLAAYFAVRDIFNGRYYVLSGPLTLGKLTEMLALTLACSYLRELARRAPSPRLSRLAGYLAAVPLASIFYSFIRNSDWPPDVIPLLLLPATATLLIAFARLLTRDARQADQNWSTDAIPV